VDESREVDDQELREELLLSLKELGEASQRVHESLNAGAGSFSLVRTLVQDGRRLSELAELIDPVPLRAAIAESMVRLERARHVTQRAMFRLLKSEGMTNADIARMWGISRQLVSRIVNEEE
jgi:CRP-like cAMP-binding protein